MVQQKRKNPHLVISPIYGIQTHNDLTKIQRINLCFANGEIENNWYFSVYEKLRIENPNILYDTWRFLLFSLHQMVMENS